MDQQTNITPMQFISLLFTSALIGMLTFNHQAVNDADVWNLLLLIAVTLFLSSVGVFIVYFLHKRNPGFSNSPPNFWVSAILLIYAAYFLFASWYDLMRFGFFSREVIAPEIAPFVLILAVILAVHVSNKGIEGLARASTVVLFLLCLVIILIICILLPQFKLSNFPSPPSLDFQSLPHNCMYLLSVCFYLPLALFVVPCVKGNIRRALGGANLAIYVLAASLAVILYGTLGNYFNMQPFPFYAASTIADIKFFKKFDAIYTAIFSMGMFIELSTFMLIFLHIFQKIWGKKARKYAGLIAILTLVALNFFTEQSANLANFLLDTRVLFASTTLVTVVLPLTVGVFVVKKPRKEPLH